MTDGEDGGRELALPPELESHGGRRAGAGGGAFVWRYPPFEVAIGTNPSTFRQNSRARFN